MIFLDKMKEVLQTHPEMSDQNNSILRKSLEKNDFYQALNGLKEVISNINISESEKREL